VKYPNIFLLPVAIVRFKSLPLRALFGKSINFRIKMEIFALNGQPRTSSGKEESKRLRREGLVPAVIYKSGGGESIAFAVSPKDFRHLVYTSKFKMVEITLEGTTRKCILKDIQFHPVTDAVVHLDFLELVPGVKFKASVPLEWVGQAPGVRAGGKFLPNLRQVNIMTTPEHVVDHMSADISKLKLGTSLRVRDITPVDGVEIINNGSVPIAAVEIPRALRTGGGGGGADEADEAEGGEEAAAEGGEE
jgi:large subunit ribosomal protein L25